MVTSLLLQWQQNHSPLWSSVPKAPKSIVSVWQNRAVMVRLHRDREQSVCLYIYLSIHPSFLLFLQSLLSSFWPSFLPFDIPFFLPSLLSSPLPVLLPSLLFFIPSLRPSFLLFIPPSFIFVPLLYSVRPSIPPSVAVPDGLDTAPCSAHILLHVASASCVAPVWTVPTQSVLC